MAEKFNIKQHDLQPSIEVQLLSGTDPVDLTQATSVVFLMKSRKTGLKATGPMNIAAPATAGVVFYDWQLGDTDIVGDFDAEVQVMWPADKPQTFPAHSYFTVSIGKDLGGPTTATPSST